MTRQSDKPESKQVRIHPALHQQLRVRAAKEGRTVRSVIEQELGWDRLIRNIATAEKLLSSKKVNNEQKKAR